MKKRDIWYVIIKSSKIKIYKTVADKREDYELKTTVVGSTFDEVMSLPTNPKNRVEGEIQEIIFLKQLSKTLYKL